MTTSDAIVQPGPTGSGGPTATATWFGPHDRPLFGWVHVPEAPDGRGAVLCPSLGLEGEASQFAFRTLAGALAAEGCTVLRFDYDGTGDSAGLMSDPGRMAAFLDSIAAAVAYLREAGVTQVHLVGARLGATFAVRAAERDGGIASLALWYPWAKGSQFLRYQRALRRLYADADDPVAGDDGTEIPGFVLDAELTADLRDLDGSPTGSRAPDTVLVIDAVDSATPRRRSRRGRPASGDRVRGPVRCRAHACRGDPAGRLLDRRVDRIDAGTPPPVTVAPVIRSSAVLAAPGGGAVSSTR